MTSRDPADLEPQLRALWEYAKAEWKQAYPDGPQPILTTTYRGPISQAEELAEGTSSLPFGQSLHNFKPAYAFDVAFIHEGRADWTMSLFRKFADLLKPFGLKWGGDWERLVDGPHFQLDMTAADARAGRVPILGLPVKAPLDPGSWALVVTREGVDPTVIWMGQDEDVVFRVAPDRKRVYADIRKG